MTPQEQLDFFTWSTLNYIMQGIETGTLSKEDLLRFRQKVKETALVFEELHYFFQDSPYENLREYWRRMRNMEYTIYGVVGELIDRMI